VESSKFDVEIRFWLGCTFLDRFTYARTIRLLRPFMVFFRAEPSNINLFTMVNTVFHTLASAKMLMATMRADFYDVVAF
jgi:hypothetical protein